MKKLVIAEKPSVGRDMANVLDCREKRNGYIEGKEYIVTWALGHLATLAPPESYDKKYKTWSMDHLPMMPEHLKVEVIKQTSKQYGAVKGLINRNDISEIIIATDAGREGELVARWILDKAHNQKPLKRLWISSVTDKAIREGFQKLRPAKEYNNLYYAAVARAQADWLVGMNGTRALTCKHNAQLSCGRVQTPTLSMILQRENEIRSFQPQEYYGITANAGGMNFTWKNNKNNTRVFSKESIENTKKQMENAPLIITNVTSKEKKMYSQPLYDLTELQREANKRFGFSAKNTLNIMQKLYEHHKVLTYPRTDSRYLTSDISSTIVERLQAMSVGAYKPFAARIIKNNKGFTGSYINDKKVSDHHAIIPTEQYPDFIAMSNDEKKIYDLVAKRFLAVLSEPYLYEETTVDAKIMNETLTTKGNRVIQAGYKEIYQGMDSDDEKVSTLPKVTAEQKFSDVNVKITTGKTKAPARFTEATILSAMENPVKYMEDSDKSNKQLTKTLGETGGIGTVATRADIIEKLFSSFYVEKKGEELVITSKGRQLLSLVPEGLKSPVMTADWELKLSQIANGQIKSKDFMKEIREYTKNIVSEIGQDQTTFRHDNLTNKKCPECGKKLLSVNGKNSKMLVCQDRECGYRETVSKTTNARCPVCHKKMEMVGKGDDAKFVCVCGHKEKLTKFQERRKKEGAGVSKKDVAKYMKKQKEEPINQAFAAALKGIKLD